MLIGVDSANLQPALSLGLRKERCKAQCFPSDGEIEKQTVNFTAE